MPDLNERPLEEVIAEYSDNSYVNYFNGMDHAMDELVADIFNSEDVKRAFSDTMRSMNSMDGRQNTYVLVVIAKMNVMQALNMEAPSLSALLDFSNDSRMMKNMIKNELMRYTVLPKLERREDETDEDYMARRREERLNNFNRNFFIPGCEKLTKKMTALYTSVMEKNLPPEQTMAQLAPYRSLLSGLNDNYNQKFESSRKKLDAETLKKTRPVSAALYYMSPYLESECTVRSSMDGYVKDLRNNIAEMAVIDYMKILTQAAYQNGSAGPTYNALDGIFEKEISEQAVNESFRFTQQFINTCREVCTSEDGQIDNFRQTGMIGLLTPQERQVFAMDPALLKRLSFRGEGPVKQLFFDDIDLQLNSAAVDDDRLEDLKTAVRHAERAHHMEKGAKLIGFKAEDLQANVWNLQEMSALLDSCTHFYNSSSEYRKMQDSVSELLKTARKMTGPGRASDPKISKAYTDQMKQTITRVKAYLEKKGASGTGMQFKNSYEAERVAAARAVLRTLTAKQTSYNVQLEAANYRIKFDKMYDELNKKFGLELTEEEKAACCSPERIALHKDAKRKLGEAIDCIDKEDLENLPSAFQQNIRGFLKKGKSEKIKEENAEFLKKFTKLKTDPRIRFDMQKKYADSLNKAQLDVDRLDLNRNSVFGAAEYAVKNMDGVILAQGMPDSKEVDETFYMKEKGIADEVFTNLRDHLKQIGNTGSSLVTLMADDLAFMLPVDQMIKQGIRPDEVDAAQFPASVIDATAKNTLLSCMESTAALKDRQAGPLHPVSLALFDGALTSEKVQQQVEARRKQRELKNGITHKASVWTPPSEKKRQAAGKPAEDKKQEDVKQEEVKQGKQNIKVNADPEDELNENLNIGVEIQKMNLQHDLDLANEVKDNNSAFEKAAKEANEKADKAYQTSLKNIGAAGKEADPYKQKPEELLGKQIAGIDRENQKRFLKLPLAVINARTRMQANCQAKNIYPEFMEDIRTLLFAEHLKREYLRGFEMAERGHCDTKAMITDPKHPEVSALHELMNGKNADPENKFEKMRSSFNFGRPLQNMQKSLRQHDGDFQAVKLMKSFTEHNGAEEVYENCRSAQRETLKNRNVEVVYVPKA